MSVLGTCSCPTCWVTQDYTKWDVLEHIDGDLYSVMCRYCGKTMKVEIAAGKVGI